METEKICGNCKAVFVGNGRTVYCSDSCCLEGKREVRRRWKRTLKGREAAKRYNGSEAHRLASIRYTQTDAYFEQPERIKKAYAEGNSLYVGAVELYKMGYGLGSVAKALHSTPSWIGTVLRHLGVSDASKTNAKKEGGRGRGPRPYHLCFTQGQKNRIFAREKGICQLCSNPVGSLDWCIHHIEPVFKAPEKARDESNGMLLHQTCHLDNFHELHGFPKPTFYCLESKMV